MYEASLFLAALPFLLFGLLTRVKAPAWANWKLALLAGEYGHWFAPVPLAIAGFARGGASHSTLLPLLAYGTALMASALLCWPIVRARALAPRLEKRLEESFGAVALGRRPFSLWALMSDTLAQARVERRKFTDELELDFYHPQTERGGAGGSLAPCIVVIHGGGWDGGDCTEFAAFNHRLARRGFAVAALSYRLAPQFRWPAQRDDVLQAIAWLKAHAAELRLDPARFVLFGRSAGGSIAEIVAYTAGDPAIRGVAAFYAPADLRYAWDCSREGDVLDPLKLLRQYLGGSPAEEPAAYRDASAYYHVHRDAPPTLLVHGALDPIVWRRQSERLAARLKQHHASHAFVSLPWATHAFEYNLKGPGGQLATYALDWFVAAVTVAKGGQPAGAE